MAKKKTKITQKKLMRFECPNCGNANFTDDDVQESGNRIQHVEWIPVYRNIQSVEKRPKGVTVHLDYDNFQDETDLAKDEGFECGACGYAWRKPKRVKID